MGSVPLWTTKIEYVFSNISHLKNDVEWIFIEINVPCASNVIVVEINKRPLNLSIAKFNDMLYGILSNGPSTRKPCIIMGFFTLDISQTVKTNTDFLQSAPKLWSVRYSKWCYIRKLRVYIKNSLVYLFIIR